jgi:Fur family zinc uptake transcriptional regulator
VSTDNALDDVISPFFGDHDHQNCQTQALDKAIQQCQKKGLKLTKLRQQVLEIIWSSHEPIGAYEVLQALQKEGHKPAPPTAYRALDFLVTAHLIHRIESLNAYIGCPSPNDNHQCQFYICQDCGHIAEVDNPDVASAIVDGANALGFKSQQPVIEVHGICKDCQDLALL